MIFRSTYPDVDIPDVSLPAFVLKGATALGNKPAPCEIHFAALKRRLDRTEPDYAD